MKKYAVLFSIVCVAGLLLVACGKDDEPNINPNDTNAINEWIYKTMDQNYLWYDEMPAKTSLNFKQEPEAFFKALLSDNDGKRYDNGRAPLYFSTIEKKTATKAISDTEPTYGFEFAILLETSSNTYYYPVLYVLPDSPAEKAGLKRGDWIVDVGKNHTKITDYTILLKGDPIVLNLAQTVYDSNNRLALKTIPSVSLEAARVMESNPILKDTVLHVGGKRIGYLSYLHFSSGPDDNSNKAYDNQLKEIFAQFKTQQVNEFVLDLRYNGGGLVSSAQVLTSLLGPSEIFQKGSDIFGYMKYNDKIDKEATLYFDKTSDVISANLNLNQLYVLIGQQTASASEAVINMLIPYMGRENIILIGEKTIGKNVGSQTFGEDKDYGWLLHPITLRIYNKDRKADYDNGFVPDEPIDEFDKPLPPLGDPNEYLLATAIQKITGSSQLKSAPVYSSPWGKPIRYSLDERGVKGLIVEPNN